MNHKYKKYFDKKSAHHNWPKNGSYTNKTYDFIISIPCYDEYDYLFKTIKSIQNQNNELLKNTLISIVINIRYVS